MSPAPMGLKSTIGIVMLAAFFYATFTMGTLMGGSAAMNESVEYEESYQEVAALDDQIKQNMTEDGASGEFVAAYASPMIDGAIHTALWGMDAGYSHPGLAKAHGEAFPIIVFSGVGVFVYRFYRKVRGR